MKHTASQQDGTLDVILEPNEVLTINRYRGAGGKWNLTVNVNGQSILRVGTLTEEQSRIPVEEI